MKTKYETLRNQLIVRLRHGDWQPGERLPGGRDLAHEAGCNPVTMERVIRELVQSGYLTRQPRLGTFVAPRENWDRKPTTPNSTRLIGILSVGFPEALLGIETTLQAGGWTMVVRNGPTRIDEALKSLKDLVEQGVQGIIWSPLSTPDHEADNTRLAGAILATGLPAVAVDRYPESVEVNCVVSDNAQAGYLLTRHLIDLGHKRIGLLRHKHGSTPIDRHRGYLRAMREAGLPDDPELVLQVAHDLPPHELVTLVRQWLTQTRPSAVWSITGHMFGGAVLAAAQAERITVPEELSFATFDDAVAPWPVTRVLQPMRAIGERAASLLTQLIANPTTEVQRIVLRCTLVDGKSCLKCP